MKLIIDIPYQINECLNNENEWTALLLAEIKDIVNNGISLEKEPCEDCRQAVIDTIRRIGMCKCNTNEIEAIDECRRAVEALPFFSAEPKTRQFAEWVATEIFDEMWEYNTDAFAEIACRKLAKLGIVKAKGGMWELVEPQESEVSE